MKVHIWEIDGGLLEVFRHLKSREVKLYRNYGEYLLCVKNHGRSGIMPLISSIMPPK